MSNENSNGSRLKVCFALLEKFTQDFEFALAAFPQKQKLELVEHLLLINSFFSDYIKNPSPELQNQIWETENSFVKTHGRIAKPYIDKRISGYHDYELVLIEKGIYTAEEWNDLDGEQQQLRPNEAQIFINRCSNLLHRRRQMLWLEQTPDYLEAEQQSTPQNPLMGSAENAANEAENKRRKALDKATVLSQEQSVLLLHYLKEIKVFLREHNLSNKDAGLAFGILTGYSHDTIRQKLGKIETIQTAENLAFLYNYIVRLQKAIDNDLKELEKPE